MEKRITTFVGLDVSDKFTEVCVLDDKGAVVDQDRIRTTQGGLAKRLSKLRNARVILEVGVHSRWMAELIGTLGHEVIVANPRQVRLIWQRRTKSDRSDALVLARLGRLDVQLLAPVQHRSRGAQIDLACARSRDILVRQRTHLISHVRGMLKPFGHRVPDCVSTRFVEQAEAVVPAELLPALGPVLAVLRTLNEQIASQDKQIEHLARTVHPVTARLTQVAGVGDLTALAYLLTIEDPARFKKSRFVASFLGLVPGKGQSGERDPQQHITKTGDPFVRRLLVQCAQYTLGPLSQDSDLKRWGLALAARGGANAKKRAIVAVARKMAVLLHRLWLSGQPYRPLGYGQTPQA
jgi:transposase